MSVTDAWIEHSTEFALDDDDRDIDLGIVPGRFDCFTDDYENLWGPRSATFEEALAWFAEIGMPPQLKLSGEDQWRLNRIETAKER